MIVPDHESVGEFDLFVRAQAVGGEIAVVRGPVERVLAPLMLERRDVLERYAVGGAGVDPGLAHGAILSP